MKPHPDLLSKPGRVRRWLYAQGYRPDPRKGAIQAILYSPSLAMYYAFKDCWLPRRKDCS